MLPNEATWTRLDRDLQRLLALSDGERDAWLDRLARDEPALARQLRLLLDRDAASTQLDRLGESPLYMEAMRELERLERPDHVGGWQLLERIGTGGMSEVYAAQRSLNGSLQQGAIKLMAQGPLPVALRARFAAETAILVRLDDPRIARLIDAGVLADGRAWLATERIDGVFIDRHCDDRRLGLHARARLLIEVALAVDSAHRQLVVHRDLKPANILVGDNGQVKVLDFGIARWLDSDADAASDHAGSARAHTPGYASPEQLRGEPAGTASDIYQLGLLLYVLATGRRPFADARSDPTVDVLATETRPTPASRHFDNDADGASDRARRRAMSAMAIRRTLAGDFDAIIARALDPDPGRRYPSALALAEDLRDWLDNRPVRARDGGPGYRSIRWLRRHRFGAILAAAGALTCCALAAAWLVQIVRTADQARTSAAILSLLEQVLHADQLGALPQRPDTVSSLLDSLDERAERTLVSSPTALARTLVLIGHARLGRGDYRGAADALTRAYASVEPTVGEAALRRSLYEPMVTALHYAGDYAQALAWSRRGLRELDHLSDEAQVALLLGHSDLTHSLGDYDDAQRHAERALALATARFGSAHPRTARGHQMLGMVLRDRGEYVLAIEHLRRAAAIETQSLGFLHVNLAATLDHLAMAHLIHGDLAAARSTVERVIAIREHLFQPGSLARAWGHHRLALIHLVEGHPERTVELLNDMLSIYAQSLRDNSHIIALARGDLGWALLAIGRADEARDRFEQADRVMAGFANGQHPRRSEILLGQAMLAQFDHDPVLVRQRVTHAIDLRSRQARDDHPTLAAACRIAAMSNRYCAAMTASPQALPLRQVELARAALLAADRSGNPSVN